MKPIKIIKYLLFIMFWLNCITSIYLSNWFALSGWGLCYFVFWAYTKTMGEK